MSAEFGKAGVGFVGGFGEICSGDNHRRGRVFQQVNFRSKVGFATLGERLEQVFHRPSNTVALRLSGYHHRIVFKHNFHQPLIRRDKLVAVGVGIDLRRKGRIVLGEGVLPLENKLRLGIAGNAVEENRLLHRGHKRVPHAAQHGVKRPNRVLILAPRRQCFNVVPHVALGLGGRQSQNIGKRGVEAPPPLLNILARNHRERRGMVALRIHPKRRVENLHRQVCIHRGGNVGDVVQILVDVAAKADVILNRTVAGASGDEKFKIGQAEGVLDVNQYNGYAKFVARGGRNGVARSPRARLLRPRFVIHLPESPNCIGLKVLRNG